MRRSVVALLVTVWALLGTVVAAQAASLVVMSESLGAVAAVSAAAGSVTVTFKAEGGRIGSKMATTKKVVKENAIGKLPAAKRAGYAFKGWYTKRSGGGKVTATTKIRKATTLYARWTRVLTAVERKLVGAWSSGPATPIDKSYRWIEFRSDGTFTRNHAIPPALSSDYQHYWHNKGLWRVAGNQIVATSLLESVEWHANNDSRGYTDKRIADQRWTYLFDDKTLSGRFAGDGLTWLRINHYPSKGGYEQYGLDYVKPTQVQ